MKSFEISLREQCQQRGGKRAARILKFLDRNPQGKLAQKLHRNRLERMEDQAELALLREGIDFPTNDRGAIDWSKIPWESLFKFIMELVTKLLDAFL